jgi:hypothetical protein
MLALPDHTTTFRSIDDLGSNYGYKIIGVGLNTALASEDFLSPGVSTHMLRNADIALSA